MCNCIKNTEDKIKTELPMKNKDYENSEIHIADIQNVMLVFDSAQSVVLYSPVKIEYEQMNNKGISKLKKKTINMIYNYCPFCGEKY